MLHTSLRAPITKGELSLILFTKLSKHWSPLTHTGTLSDVAKATTASATCLFSPRSNILWVATSSVADSAVALACIMAQSALLSRERTDEVSSCSSSSSGRKEERRPRHEAASNLFVCVCVWGEGGQSQLLKWWTYKRGHMRQLIFWVRGWSKTWRLN